MDFNQKTERNNPITEQTPKESKGKFLKLGGILVIILGLAILAYPFFPYLRYQLFPPTIDYSNLNINSLIKKKGPFDFLPLVGNKKSEQVKKVTGNRLVVPKIGVNSPISEGTNENALLKGAWRLPNTSTPDQDGNTVITGHRFRFRPPNNTTFYLLDKISKGDDIFVIWNEKQYHYKVTETKVVDPNQLEIITNPAKPTLTLYTCTPLFTTKQRLVVTSELI